MNWGSTDEGRRAGEHDVTRGGGACTGGGRPGGADGAKPISLHAHLGSLGEVQGDVAAQGESMAGAATFGRR